MTAIRPASARPTSATTRHHLDPADLKTAGKLKSGIETVLQRVRFGAPLAAADAPKHGRDGAWIAPNGDRLIGVDLGSPPPPGSADMPTHFALVNPKTNTFYSMSGGGFTGLVTAHGPLALPAGLKFKGKTFTAADIKKLEAAANAPPPAKVPTKQQMLAAMGAYEFQGMLRYGSKAPAAKDVLQRIPLKKENVADGFTFTAIVLKANPNTFIIERSGGFAGLTQYSQAIDVTRIPK